MRSTAKTLIDIAKAIAPDAGYLAYYDLINALDDNDAALTHFQQAIQSAQPDDLAGIGDLDRRYGWIVLGAAEAMGFLTVDPCRFLSDNDAALLRHERALESLGGACILNDIESVSRLASQVNVNALDHNKQVPLGYAVGNNRIECVKILLAAAADPNRVQNWGNTPMHICAQSESSKQIFHTLLKAGGDVTIRNDNGHSVLDLLEKYGRRNWNPR